MFNIFNKSLVNIPKSVSDHFNSDLRGFAKKYTDSNGYNMILSKNMLLGLDSIKTRRNCNVLIDGMAGVGKSRNIIIPNLLQANCSYMIIDPVGIYYSQMAEFFKNEGYVVRVLNLYSHPSLQTEQLSKHNSVVAIDLNHYNPFEYIEDEKDVRDVVECIIANSEHVPFYRHKLDSELAANFRKQIKAFLTILISYVSKLENKDERTFATIINILSNEDRVESIIAACSVSPEFTFLHKEFEDVQGPETRRRMLVEAFVDMSFALIPRNEKIMECDDMELRTFGEKKTVCFIVVPTFKSGDCLASLIITQLQNIMEKESRKHHNGKLPIHATCVLDEFANCGYIPRLDERLATCRPINMNYMICVQRIGQIRGLYGEKWKEIAANCDSHILLSPPDIVEFGYVNKDACDFIWNKFHSKVCLIIMKGEKPFLDYIYDVEKHQNYKNIRTT